MNDFFESTGQERSRATHLPSPTQDPQHASNTQQEPTRKRKRDKYAGKACGPCKKRKIKCGGDIPCAPCVQRKRYCTAADSLDANDTESASLAGGNMRAQDSTQGLHERLAALESQLKELTRALLPTTPLAESNHSISIHSPDTGRSLGSSDRENQVAVRRDTRMPQDGTGASPKDHLSFASGKNLTTGKNLGETSVTHALQRVEERLTELGLPVIDRESAPGTPPMTPLPSDSREPAGGSTRHRVLRALQDNSIIPCREKWDDYLETFLVEVHPLYPFSHQAQLAERYRTFWAVLSPENNQIPEDDFDLDHIFQLLLMLAVGHCTLSSRVHTGEGIHSAGWSLYCTALDLRGSLLDTVNDDSKPLSSLHSLTLVVIYLMRLDATERAQKVLSLAIIHAQQLGIHLSETHDDMPAFDSEMFKRVWWCLYILDRRVALVLGRPFIIQDNNIQIGLAEDLETTVAGSSRGSALDFFHIEAQDASPSPIQYLNAMAGYSKLVGKVWETLFSSDSTHKPGPHTHEYLDSLAHNWMDTVPNILICDHKNVHQSDLPISRPFFKQRFLIRIRYLYIFILIRSPMRRPRAVSWARDNQSDMICLQNARHIVNMFSQCTVADGVYGFPFLPYLLEVTIVILACLTHLPTLKWHYRGTVQIALQMLTEFYKKSWVSGKMARIIFKLGDVIPRVFATDESYMHQIHHGSDFGLEGSSDMGLQLGGLQGPDNMPPQQDQMTQSHSSSAQHPSAVRSMWHIETLESRGGKRLGLDGQNITPIPDSQADQMPGVESTMENPQHSMIADFPFELNFGNTALNAIAPSHQPSPNDGEDFSTTVLGGFDLEWLSSLISNDSLVSAPT